MKEGISVLLLYKLRALQNFPFLYIVSHKVIVRALLSCKMHMLWQCVCHLLLNQIVLHYCSLMLPRYDVGSILHSN